MPPLTTKGYVKTSTTMDLVGFGDLTHELYHRFRLEQAPTPCNPQSFTSLLVNAINPPKLEKKAEAKERYLKVDHMKA
ncbi:hypothetical protein L915_02036 [Phytophthora nicotianae]|uniref:Uncharacterized protein n=1 Tax=Phytophthora nicotianae TaxID=4792 RepID=W2HIR3_PHYNI|nr:hypothetical protein L915_02036 [Phytophthora nicotianae]ETM30742.1 hypothetical protein L914_21584 [Phytophthora nicotianae]